MKQAGVVKHNDDPGMQPYVVLNHGPCPMLFTSILEEKRWDLVEFEDSKKIMVYPGQRKIIPHDYFQKEVVGIGTARLDHFLGKAAPELKGYRRAYRMKLVVKPWYKKISDFFVND